ncbi:MAG TPA: LysR substrate-binding domain-containing protein [Polyangiaceae bacterium]|nr:LysR substrate-binding domain-containing protein [Polyangiaceae bacterium]
MQFYPHSVTLRQLQYIVAVAEHRSFREAAHACRVAQPSLSAQVAQAEASIGFSLFERKPRQIHITAPGTSFIERARSVLTSADLLFEQSRALVDPEQGRVRIGVIPTIGPYLLPEVAPALRKRFPRMTIVWSEEKTPALLTRIEHRELDAIIAAKESDLRGLRFESLGEDPFVVAVSRRHRFAAASRVVHAEELAKESVLILEDGHCFRDQVLAYCAQSGGIESDFRSTSLPTLVQMAAAGLGVTLLPRLAVAVENRTRELSVRRIEGESSHRTLVLAWSSTSPLLRTMLLMADSLRTAYQEMVRRTVLASRPGAPDRVYATHPESKLDKPRPRKR